MRIIFDIHTSPASYLSASGTFLTELVADMAAKYPQHSFVYLAGERFPKSGNLPGNVSIHHTNKILSKWFGKKFWRKYILPKELNKLKADLYVTSDNLQLGKTVMPVSLFLLHATEMLRDPVTADKSRSGAKTLLAALKGANQVITFSDHDRQVIQTLSQKPAPGIRLLLPCQVEIPELKWTEKEMVKIDFATGVEYFVFAGDLHERYDLIGLLKAFALFKKWQQSNMRLIIAGNYTTWTAKFKSEFASFKYRDEVNLMVNPSKEKLQKVIAGAYAFVYPATYDSFPVNVLQAVHAGVPVISSSIEVCKEWCGDTLMYPESNDAAGFAKSMQLIYKDERLRSSLIDSAKKRLQEQHTDDMLKTCMNFFEETIAK